MAICFFFFSILAGWSTWQWVFLNFSQHFWFSDTPRCASAVFAENEIWNRLKRFLPVWCGRPPWMIRDSSPQDLCKLTLQFAPANIGNFCQIMTSWYTYDIAPIFYCNLWLQICIPQKIVHCKNIALLPNWAEQKRLAVN